MQFKYILKLNEWTNKNHKSTYPQQKNGVDRGVFTSKCTDFISDGLVPDYEQQNMELFRKTMKIDIICGYIWEIC